MRVSRLGSTTAVRCAVVVGLVLAVVLVTGRAAHAHASLVATNPSDGATVADEPSQVSLEFNQNVGTPAYVTVKAPDGSRVDAGDPDVVDDTVTQHLEHAGLSGRYTVSYRVVSADGHPVEGTLTYTVESGREGATPAPSQSGDDSQTFVQQHSTHLLWGLGGVVVAAVLLLWPRRRRHD